MSQLNSTKLFACFLIFSTVIVSTTAHSSFGSGVPAETASTETVNPETPLPEGFSKKEQIKIKQVSIAGVSLGSTTDFVKSKLGQPQSKTTPYFMAAPEQFVTTWEYPGLKIYFRSNVDKESNYYIHGLSTTSSQYATDLGIRVGDPVSKVKQVYAAFSMKDSIEKDSTDQDVRTVAFAEGPAYSYNSLSFKIGKTGNVEEISLDFVGSEC